MVEFRIILLSYLDEAVNYCTDCEITVMVGDKDLR